MPDSVKMLKFSPVLTSSAMVITFYYIYLNPLIPFLKIIEKIIFTGKVIKYNRFGMK
jgi:hypothetical protein